MTHTIENKANPKVLVRWAQSVKIAVPKYEYRKLVLLAIAHYNDRQIEQEKIHRAGFHCDVPFLFRLCHNFLRHKCTKYEALTAAIDGIPGNYKAYSIIREKVNGEIDRLYPGLEAYLQLTTRRYAEMHKRKASA